MKPDRLDRQVRFILEIDQLKSVLRQAYLCHSERREDSAQHSWHAAVAAQLLAEYSDRAIDRCRVLQMLLVHDIVEIDAGDTYCFDNGGQAGKAEREERAAARLFGMLPTGQSEELYAIWREFEAGQTPEAQFAVAIDRLLPLLHNYWTQGKLWKDNRITSDLEYERIDCIRGSSRRLWELANFIIHESVRMGYLAQA